MNDIATCGHEIDSDWSVYSKGIVHTKDYTREGKRAISYQTLCPACLKYYRKHRLILDTPEQRDRWIGVKGFDTLPTLEDYE